MLRIWRERRLCSNLDQLYLWTYWISQRLNPSYFGFLIALAGLPSPWKIAVARQPLERKFSAGAGLCLATVFFQVTIRHVQAGGLPLRSSAFLLQRSWPPLAPRAGHGLRLSRLRLRRLRQLPHPRPARALGTLLKRAASSPGTASRSTATLTRDSAGRATARRLTHGPLFRPPTRSRNRTTRRCGVLHPTR